MSTSVRVAACFAGLLIGCLLMLEFAGGQEGLEGGKGKKEKTPKGEKGEKGDKGNPEDKAVYKTVEKASKPGETEREKWLKELTKAFPGQVSPGMTRDDFEQWFDLLAGDADWRRGDAPMKQIAELFDRAADRMNLGDVPSIRRDEFLNYAQRFLLPGGSPPWKTTDPLAEAEKIFKQLDRDRSGLLEPGEWPERLRAKARDYDADRDGRISFDEYRLYFEGRVITIIEKGTEEPIPLSPPSGPNLPVPTGGFIGPIRYGHLPPGLPRWFVDQDSDRVGQISLYEWRQAGFQLPEFLTMDLDGDGLLPPDEYLRYIRYYYRPVREE